MTGDVGLLGTALDAVSEGLTGLAVEGETLKAGESIVGVTIPRAAVDGGFRYLQRELAFFAQFLVEVTEVVEGKADEHKVQSLRSSDFGIDVTAQLMLWRRCP